MEKHKEEFVTIWGDTVNFRQLLLGLVGGAVLGYLSLIGGLSYLKSYHPGLGKALLMGYALLFGVGGCIVAAMIAGRVFKPKRIYSEEDRSVDKQAVLRELNIDLKQEAEYLKQVSPQIIHEMKQLQLYELFVTETNPQGGGK
ncbi:MAG: hypothetical protein P4N59_07845 [Negativicutes bacterium]|nr:hypothetical protein [Negativicutes bacterium]